MGATENAGFNAKVQRIAEIYPRLDRLLSYLIARRQWYVCRNTNHTTYFTVCPQKRYAAPAPCCYCWWGTMGVKGAHGESESASPRGWGGRAPSGVHGQSLWSVDQWVLRYGASSLEHSNSRFESILFDSLRESIRIYSFSKKIGLSIH